MEQRSSARVTKDMTKVLPPAGINLNTMTTMKKYFLMAVAAIVTLSSCSSDDAILNESGHKETGATKFTATIEDNDATRATYNATTKKAEWVATTDKINVGGTEYTAQTTGPTTTFTGSGASIGTDDKYHAYFPASLYNGGTPTLPAEISETWADGQFNMPMYAESTTTDFVFKNLCGVLKITVKNNQIAAVKKIKVSSKDKAISGTFAVTSDAAVLSSPSIVANNLTITYTDAVSTTAEGKVFYIAVPAQTYKELKIELSADGTNFTNSMTTKASTDITIARNTIYPITFAEDIPQWENQLSLGGRNEQTGVTDISIETGVNVSGYTEDGNHKKLNAKGTLWEVLDGTTLRIQTSASKILGHDAFPNGNVNKKGLFEGYHHVSNFEGLDKLDMSQVTDMSNMFYSCSSIEVLDLSSFNTSQVEYMTKMFHNCIRLSYLDLSSFDTRNVSSFAYMFSNIPENSVLIFGNDFIIDDTILRPDLNSMFSLKLSKYIYIKNAPNVTKTSIRNYGNSDNGWIKYLMFGSL